MLAEETAGRPYVKARVNKRLQTQIGRSHGSVEFKLCNISAVLDDLAFPTIEGYQPRRHIQNALYGAVERYLDQRPQLVSAGDLSPRPWEPALAETATMFESPPPGPAGAAWMRDPGLERLVRKFDPGARDARNRALGKAGKRSPFNANRTACAPPAAPISPAACAGWPRKTATAPATTSSRSTREAPNACWK
jgi:hypothetical protein